MGIHLAGVGGGLTEVFVDWRLTVGTNVTSGAGTGGGVALAILLAQTSIVTLELWPQTQWPWKSGSKGL